MSLLSPLMVKNGVAATTLTLEADSGKSLLVKDILVKSVADVFLSVKIDKTLAGYFSVDAAVLGNSLGYTLQSGVPPRRTILKELADMGVFAGYPIAEGQKMVLSGLGATAMFATIIYEEYESGDITEDMQNGTECSEYVILNYGDTGSTVAAAGDQALDNQVSPKDFPEFPFGKVVPAKKEIDIHALLASERAADDGSTAANYVRTTYYKLKRERETLFDEDVAGIYAQGATVGAGGTFEAENGQSILAEGSDLYERPLMRFKTPLHFDEGEELNAYMTTEVAATPGAFLQEETRVATAMTVRRIG